MSGHHTEAQLQAAIVKAIHRRWPTGWVFHPVGNPWQATGLPDLLCSIEGRFIGIEVKHPKPGESEQHARDRTTVTQRHVLGLISASGGTAGTVLSEAEAIALIEDALEGRDTA